jgi:Uma2 family endonuclease
MAVVVSRDVHRFTAAEYQRMAEAGVLPYGARTELEDGVVVDMSPTGREHARLVDLMTALLHRTGVPANGLGAPTYLRTRQPVEIDERRQYQPDFSVVRGPLERYADRLPGAADALLVVEIADATLDRDLREKLPAYRAAGFPAVVVVDVANRVVHSVARQRPDGPYEEARLTGDDEWYPGVRVAELFPGSG